MKLFVHIPKCAGTSVLSLLENLAKGELAKDYDSYFKVPQPQRNDLILTSLLCPAAAAKEIIVYGHFFPVKYIGTKNKSEFTLVTILRDPIDRLYSHYSFWNSGDYSDHDLWRKMKSEKWDFSQFAFSSEMRNIYAQYFSQVSLGSFDYIGLYENLEPSVARCLAVLGLSKSNMDHVPHQNMTSLKGEIPLSADTMRSLREYHAEDYLIYQFAAKKFSHCLDGST